MNTSKTVDEIVTSVVKIFMVLLSVIIIVLLLGTFPLWILPYLIYKKLKNKTEVK